MLEEQKKAVQREILLSFWRIHILHHASKEPIVGQWMLKELQRHGYDVSPGTLYPMLHRMEKLGWLKSSCESEKNPKARRFFVATQLGKEVLTLATLQFSELQSEAGKKNEKKNGNEFRKKTGKKAEKKARKKPVQKLVQKPEQKPEKKTGKKHE